MSIGLGESTVAVRVHEGDALPAPAWHEYAARADMPLGFDLRWRPLLERFLRARYLALVAWEGKEITGLLPLAVTPRPCGRRALVSLPICNCAGLLTPRPAVAEALLRKAEELRETVGASRAELRHAAPVDSPLLAGPAPFKATFHLPLTGGAAAVWEGLKSSVRNKVRKAERQGVVVREGPQWLGAFYATFCETMRDLGTPVLPRSFFEAVLEQFGDEALVHAAFRGNEVVGGRIALCTGDTVTFMWGVSPHRYHTLAAMDAMNWQALKTACARGAARGDFGRATVGSGPYRYKQGWGGQQVDLHWQYLPAQAAPADGRRGRTMERLSSLWQRLPLPLTAALGPRIAHLLPW